MYKIEDCSKKIKYSIFDKQLVIIKSFKRIIIIVIYMRFNRECKIRKPIGNINNIFDFIVKDLDNNDVPLSDYKDLNPIIVVNVASL
tara:strand:- start:62 stop:322 length:261 start_codon:yes stop_codon:yes gene_type:complete